MKRGRYRDVLVAYIDDSGHPEDSPSFVLAAFLTTAREWSSILRDWQGIVYRSKVTAFHATDCANGASEFEGWSNARKINLFRNLINIVARHSDLKGRSAGVLIKDYQAEVDSKTDALFGGPRGLVFQLLLLDIVKAASSPVAFIMDKPSKGWGILDELFQKTKQLGRPWCKNLHSLTPGNIRTFPAIQTADLLAYETYRYLNQKTRNEPPRKMRRSLQRLIVEKALWGHGAYFDRAAIKQLIEVCKEDGKL